MAETLETLKPVIKSKDMEPELEAYVMELVKQSLKKHSWQEMASFFQEQLNFKSPGHWHCFVGRYFGSYVTFESKHYIYFYVGQIAFLLFKTFKN